MTVPFPGRAPYERWRYTYSYVPPAPELAPDEVVVGVFDVEEPGTYRSFTQVTAAPASIHVYVRGDVRYAPNTALIDSSYAVPPNVYTWITQLELYGGERVTVTVSDPVTGGLMNPGSMGCELVLMTPPSLIDTFTFREQDPIYINASSVRPLSNAVPYVLERCGLTPRTLTPGEYADVAAAILRSAHRDVNRAVFEVNRMRYVRSTQQVIHDPTSPPYTIGTGVIPPFSADRQPAACHVDVRSWHGGWRIECTCGERGETRPDRRWADADYYNHVIEYETRLLRENNVTDYGSELAEAGHDTNRTREARPA